ncbi:MAG: ABC transporter ATP-binding protein [Lachnospiraceae bacterium]|nr:ABC transporter ATP-binding protein [Lachnospiraceae bacterium]
MSDNTLLKIDKLSKSYIDDANEHLVLKDLDLEVEKSEFLCILGPSGCGKSTLLRCIAGFEEYSGSVYVNGEKRNTPGIDRFMVFQDFNQLFPWKSVLKNVSYPLTLNTKASKAEIKEQALSALEKVGLSECGDQYPHQLSGGMKQRVAIAKALALRSPIILMDEPFAALDAMTRSGLQKEMISISEREKNTIIFITHNIQEALILGTRILVFGQQGHILFDRKNPMKRPVTPASEGYGALWEELHQALYEGSIKRSEID